MVGAAVLRRAQRPAQQLRGGAGDVAGVGRTAPLVVDDAQLSALGGQTTHGIQKIMSLQGVDPARSQDEIHVARGADRPFAGQLAAPVDAERRRRSALAVGSVRASVEHVVGRVVDEPRSGPARCRGHDPGSLGVHALGNVVLRFGAVDGRIGRGVDHEIGLVLLDAAHNGCGIAHVDLGTGQRHELDVGSQALHQRAAHLTVAAEYQYAHRQSVARRR